MKENKGVKLKDPDKIQYMKLMRDVLGDLFNSKNKQPQRTKYVCPHIQRLGFHLEDCWTRSYPNRCYYEETFGKNNTNDTKEKHWAYYIVDVPEERCLGIMLKTRKIHKLVSSLEKWGIMVIKETKLQKIGRVKKTDDESKLYILSLRIPEEQDIEKYL